MTRPRWLNESEQRAWRTYLAMNAQLTARLNRQLQEESQLSLADYDVLVHLTDHDDGCARVLKLARDLQWEKSRLSHHLSRMERRGLIARVGCPTDARGAFVVLTPAGRAAIEDAAPRHVDTVRALVFDQLTPELVDLMHALASRVLTRLQDTA
jgi:DNA-binding MarR family transcriptional regulator